MSAAEELLAFHKACAHCKREFVPKRLSSPRHKGLFCSRQCFADASRARGNVQAICPSCDKPFTHKRGEAQKFCSRACAANAHRGAANPSWTGGKVRLSCGHCGKEFFRVPARSGAKFCSMACAAARNAADGVSAGERNPNWRGGLTKMAAVCKACGVGFTTRADAPALYCSKDCFYTADFSGRTAKRWGTRWGRAKTGKRVDLGNQFFRSGWEANYARYLNWLKERGEIERWEYEPDTFQFHKIKKGTRFYTPDFKVWERGNFKYHEIKGWKHPKGETALKRMAIYYPSVPILMVDTKAYNAIKRAMSKLVPGWE